MWNKKLFSDMYRYFRYRFNYNKYHKYFDLGNRETKSIEFFENGNISYIAYSKQFGNTKDLSHDHRIDGPSYERFYEDGSIYYRSYYIDGQLHRTDGPATEDYMWTPQGSKLFEKEYYIQGKKMDEIEFERMLKLKMI